MGKRESVIQGKIIDDLVRWQWTHKKTHPGTGGTPKGWPDLEIMVPGGRIVYMEVKREGVASAEAMQNHWHNKLVGDGYYVFLVNSHEHAIGLLKGVYERHGRRAPLS